jgi:hypothetical protein
MSASQFRSPVSVGCSARDAVVMGGGTFSRIGPKKGAARQQRRAEKRARLKALRQEVALEQLRATWRENKYRLPR